MRRSRYFIVAAAWAALFGTSAPALAQRLLGIDVSYYQGNISAANWTTLHTTNSRDFVIIRASRGGTTGFYNSANPSQDTLSRRYDDPYFVQNINRSTTAGLFAGSYHFSRPDVIETTENSGGIRNTGTDEADHFIQMAGAFMRPGYLLPVHDFEAGDGIRTDAEMAQFCIDFSARIYEKMGIRPAIYTNGNYAANILAASGGSLPAQVVAAYPKLWSARWPNQSDPNSIDVQSPNNPKDTYTPIYGPWDDAGTTHPWTFWQYASTMRLSGYNNGNSNIDVDVVNGGIEVLKDQLVPALWMKDSDGVYRDGNWSNFAKWNSGQAPIAPVTGPGQMTPIGTQTMPTARLPGTVVGTVDVTDGQNDTVILDVPSASITVTLDSGTYNIRKLYAREALNITGGSLGTNYIPPDPNIAYPSDRKSVV